MRHRVKTNNLSRTGSHRRALARNIVSALIEHERIETTVTKAKVHRPFAEKLITLAKEKNLHLGPVQGVFDCLPICSLVKEYCPRSCSV